MISVEGEAISRAVRQVFLSLGVPLEGADWIAECLLDADLSGHPSHGVYRVKEYYHACRNGQVDPRATPRIVAEKSPATLMIDGSGGFGQIVGRYAADAVSKRAAEHGMAAAAVFHSGHVGRLADHVRFLAERGQIGLMTANDAGANLVVPRPGGRVGRLGTNPFAFAVPRKVAPHLVMDFATSETSYGSLVVGRRRSGGTSETSGAYDNLLPSFGGYKGFGLSLLVEILSGVLTTAGWSTGAEREEAQGSFIMAIDPEHFCGLGYLETAVEEVLEWVQSPEGEAEGRYTAPGLLGSLRRRESGNWVSVDSTTWAELVDVMDACGVKVPGVARDGP